MERSQKFSMRRIAHISDLHFGRHEPTMVDSLGDWLNRSDLDLIVASGDFTQRARSAEFAAARRFLDAIRPPTLIIPGNHDLPLNNLFTWLFRPLAKYERHLSPLGIKTPFFADEEIAVLGIRTPRRLTGKNGRISRDQIGEIRRIFGEIDANLFKILVTHHPLGSPGGRPSVELAGGSRRAIKAIAAAGVHILLSGHHHQAISGQIGPDPASANSILVIHAGTAVSTRTRHDYGNTFNLLEIHASRTRVEVLEWTPSKGFVETKMEVYQLSDGRWEKA
jgi:3',5'-cyclic AMP phosphodiesterase CpdA